MNQDGSIRELSPAEQAARAMVCLPLDGLNALPEVEGLVEELSPLVGFNTHDRLYTQVRWDF